MIISQRRDAVEGGVFQLPIPFLEKSPTHYLSNKYA